MAEIVVEQKTLQIAENLALPRSTVTHVLAILAQRGMGKTYAALAFMEELVAQGLFVGFIDPLGIAWGIRSSADGEQAGLPVLILGGRHGDLPLDPSAGTIVAQFLIKERHPFILDLSLFDTDEEQQVFVVGFIRAFRPYDQVLLHLIVDEADLFAPQFPESTEARRSLAAMNALTRRYRFKGIGTTLISQRPAVLNKNVLQLDILIALATTSPQDVKALDAWIKRNASEGERQIFLNSLSSLPQGTAWVWSPQWLHLFQRVQIRRRSTYDSSQTPEVDTVPLAPKRLAEIDLGHLSEQMQTLLAQAQETDPAFLHRRIRELEASLQERNASSEETHKGSALVTMLRAELAQALQDLAARNARIEELEGQLTALPQDTPCEQGATLEKPGEVKELTYSEMRTRDRLIKQIKQLSPNEKALFSWLLAHDGQCIRPLALADAVYIAERATYPDRVGALLKIPFIHRWGRPIVFEATFAAYARTAFASVGNYEAVRQALLQAAR